MKERSFIAVIAFCLHCRGIKRQFLHNKKTLVKKSKSPLTDYFRQRAFSVLMYYSADYFIFRFICRFLDFFFLSNTFMVISAATAMATSTSITIKPIISISKIPKEPGSVSPEAEGEREPVALEVVEAVGEAETAGVLSVPPLTSTLIILETISDGSELPSTGT